MKNHFFLLCMLGCGLCMAQEPPVPNKKTPGQQNADITVSSLPVLERLSPDYDQRQIPELNPHIDVYLLSHVKDLSLQIAIVNNSTGAIVRKPVASDWIVVSPQASVIAIAGKKDNPGYLTKDGGTDYLGIELLDINGTTLFNDKNTGMVNQFLLNESGDMLINSARGLCLYSSEGTEKWRKPYRNAELVFVPGGEYFTADRYSFSSAIHTVDLIDAASGEIAQTFSYYTSEGLDITYASKSKREVAFSRHYGERSSSNWTLEIHNIGVENPRFSISGLKGHPCFIRPKNDGEVYEMILWLPLAGDKPNTYRIQHATWSPVTQKLSTLPLGSFGIDYETSGFYVQENISGYNLKLSNEVINIK